MQQKKLYDLLKNISDEELMLLRAEVDAELSSRGISFNVGILGEKLAVEFFNSTPGLPNLILAPPGAKNVDALSRDGDRYSIKTSLKAKKTGTIYPDNNDGNKQLFEFILIVRLDKKYQLNSIYRFSWEDFLKVRAWDKRMNAWYVALSDIKLQQGEQLLANL